MGAPAVGAPAVGAVVLAAGEASRFGSVKPIARLVDRPILQHVLDALAAAAPAETVAVLGRAADEIEAAISWRGERVVRNPDPAAGLSSSLRVGMAALGQTTQAALLLLGDQPLVRPEVLQALLTAASSTAGDPARPCAFVPRYAEGGGANPVLLLRRCWPILEEATGDRGLGPVLARHPELVREVPVPGANPDVDTPADLAALAWGMRVRANREQVDRFREAPDPVDFYGPVTGMFRADPRRTDDPVLDVLRSLVRPGETWLDIGAGAGRFALPIALLAGQVIALDPSAGMLAALREQAASAGIANVRTIESRWPLDPGREDAPVADVSLIANVGHDTEGIGPFLDGVELAARRLCVAVMTERQPAWIAERFWPPIHGEARVTLPALPELLELLEALGRRCEVTMLEQAPRGFPDEEALAGFIRRQLWLEPGSAKDRRFRELLHAQIVVRADRVGLRDALPPRVGIVRWEPRHA